MDELFDGGLPYEETPAQHYKPVGPTKNHHYQPYLTSPTERLAGLARDRSLWPAERHRSSPLPSHPYPNISLEDIVAHVRKTISVGQTRPPPPQQLSHLSAPTPARIAQPRWNGASTRQRFGGLEKEKLLAMYRRRLALRHRTRPSRTFGDASEEEKLLAMFRRRLELRHQTRPSHPAGDAAEYMFDQEVDTRSRHTARTPSWPRNQIGADSSVQSRPRGGATAKNRQPNSMNPRVVNLKRDPPRVAVPAAKTSPEMTDPSEENATQLLKTLYNKSDWRFKSGSYREVMLLNISRRSTIREIKKKLPFKVRNVSLPMDESSEAYKAFTLAKESNGCSFWGRVPNRRYCFFYVKNKDSKKLLTWLGSADAKRAFGEDLDTRLIMSAEQKQALIDSFAKEPLLNRSYPSRTDDSDISSSPRSFDEYPPPYPNSENDSLFFEDMALQSSLCHTKHKNRAHSALCRKRPISGCSILGALTQAPNVLE